MEALHSSFLCSIPLKTPFSNSSKKPNFKRTKFSCSLRPDPWTLSDGNDKNLNKPKPRSKNPKNPLSDDNARRIIKAKARYLSVLRRNQGSQAQTPKWIKRTPEQMVQYLEDDRNGHLYGKHVVAAIRIVRSLSSKPDGSYDMRKVLGSFVAKLTFREMCVVLKEQRGWRQVRDFFAWMKLQLSYRPSVIAYTIVLRAYSQAGKIGLAEETFLEMVEAGCEPDEVACGTMLCAYAKFGHHKAMMSFFSAVQQRGIIPPTAVFNFMLSSLQKKALHENVICSLFEEAFKTFKEMKTLGFVPEEATYSLLINVCSKRGNYDESCGLYDEMCSQGIVPSNFTCASLLTVYYKNGDYSKALSLFVEMKKYGVTVDEVIYGLLIRIYGKLGLYQDAQDTFDEIEKLGMLSHEKTYTTMAQVHLNAGNIEKALQIMEVMKSKNILRSRFAYSVLLQCYIMKGDLSSAEVAFQTLSKKDRVEFDEELLRTVMKVYCKDGMVRDTEKFLEELSTSKIFDSAIVQTLLMVIQGKGKLSEAKITSKPLDQPSYMAFELSLTLTLADGNNAMVQEILEILLKAANGLSIVSKVVKIFAKEGDISKAENLLELLMKLGYKPEDSASASMISLYGKQKKLRQAEKIFAAVADSARNKTLLYDSMIDVYNRCNKHEEAYLFYKEEIKKGHVMGPVAISMLVNALTNCGKYQEAEDVIHSTFCANFELDTVAYNTFIKAMLSAGKLDDAANIYERMVSLKIDPSIQTYSTMISVYGRGRNLDKAMEMFNMARSRGIALDEKAYTNLISYYGKAGKIDEASSLFSKMQEEGIKPSELCYSIMIKAYTCAGAYDEAEEVHHSMQRNGVQPCSYPSIYNGDGVKVRRQGGKGNASMQNEGRCAPHIISAHFNAFLFAFAKKGGAWAWRKAREN
nr:pentatricopeptide repeat-containing protein At5g27270 [Ipomoea batatas]